MERLQRGGGERTIAGELAGGGGKPVAVGGEIGRADGLAGELAVPNLQEPAGEARKGAEAGFDDVRG